MDRVGQCWSSVVRGTGGEKRPPEISATYWWKVLSSKQRQDYWKEKKVQVDNHEISAAALFGVDESDDDTCVPSSGDEAEDIASARSEESSDDEAPQSSLALMDSYAVDREMSSFSSYWEDLVSQNAPGTPCWQE